MVSSTGAVGIMQVLPETGAFVSGCGSIQQNGMHPSTEHYIDTFLGARKRF